MNKPDLFHKLTYNHLLRHEQDTSSRGLALSEFIDNSVKSYLKMSSNEEEIGNISGCNIQIVVDETIPENIKILIKDNAGGMSKEELFDAAQEFHNSYEKSNSQINQYGIGMKLGIFWFGKNGKIWTKKRNSSEYFLDYEASKHDPNDPVYTPIVDSKENLIDGHGTIIQIEEVRDKRRLLLNSLTEKTSLDDAYDTIRNRFREYINNGLIITFKLITEDSGVEEQVLKITQQAITDTNIFKVKAFSLKNICGIKDSQKITDEQRKKLAQKKNLLIDLHSKSELKDNKNYDKLFDKLEVDEPLVIEEKIILNRKELKVKLCFLNEADNKYCGVAIMHCHRFIYHTPNVVSKKIGTMPFTNKLKYQGGIWKWMYAEVDLTDTDKYGLYPDKNKASIVWDGKEHYWYSEFEKLIDKYEDFIRHFLQPITRNEAFKSNPKLLKKQLESDGRVNDVEITKDGLQVTLQQESPISQMYELGNSKIEIVKSSKINDVFSWNEVDENCFKLEYNNDDDGLFDPKLFTEIYFLRLISLIKLISLGKYKADHDILEVINNILKG